MKPSVVLLLLLLCASACSLTVSLPTANGTSSASPPPAPPSPTPTPALPAELAVHILERFTPYRAWTAVGPFSSVVAKDDFRLMLSFKAYAFQPALTATMDCYFIAPSNSQWMPMTTVPNAMRHTNEPAFCVRRDLPDDDKSFAVAQFLRFDLFGSPKAGLRVFAEPMASAKLLELTRSRGWPGDPLASFRVANVQHWRRAPTLTVAIDPYAVTVDNNDQAPEQCPPDPTGAVERKIEGGDYYAGVKGEKPVLLCVGYAQRSLQDVQPSTSKDLFMTEVEFRDHTLWRAYRCGTLLSDMGSVGVEWKDAKTDVVFSPYKGKERLLCYRRRALVADGRFTDDGLGPVDPSTFVKRLYFDESFERRNERLRVEYHDKNAWDFPDTPLDLDAVNKF